MSIEGEEETGSAHIEKYLKKYRKKFACDGIIWEFGFVNSDNLPVVSLGMKGMLFAEFTVRGPKTDAHSSLAVLIKNPAWRLIEALHTMRAPDGRVLVDDWYKDAKKITARDLKFIAAESFDEASFKKEYGISQFVGGRRGDDAKAQLVGGATCNIAGIHSGYQGRGAKTILPSIAVAKVDFRLTLGMNPAKQRTRLLKHLQLRGFSEIKVKVHHAEAASRTNPDEKFVTQVCNAADSAFGGHVLSISSAGTGPMHQFASIFKMPVHIHRMYPHICRNSFPKRICQGGLADKVCKMHVCNNEKFYLMRESWNTFYNMRYGQSSGTCNCKHKHSCKQDEIKLYSIFSSNDFVDLL